MSERIQIAPGFVVTVDEDRVTIYQRDHEATYSVGQALAIANIMRHLIEAEAGVVKATPNGKRRVLPDSGEITRL